MDGPIAEYSSHIGTIAMYPFRNDIWRDNAKHMQNYMCDIVNIISRYENVFFFCNPNYLTSLKERYKNNKKRCNSIDNLFTFANRNK